MFHQNKELRYNKKLIWAALWVVSLFLPTLAGCEPTTDNSAASRQGDPCTMEVQPTEQAVPVEPIKSSGAIDAVMERILTGDFIGAAQVCNMLNANQDVRLAQLSNILVRYEELQKKREKNRLKALDEKKTELDKLRAKVGDAAFEPNDIDEALSIVVRMRDLRPEDEKDGILEDPFIQKVMKHAKAAADDYEKQGKWIDAYAHYYYWMTALNEDDKTYKDPAERLTETASIELSLKQNDCGKTAIDRYKGIESFMFIRALQALDSSYVHEIDYNEVCSSAVKRCRLLGRVLAESREELAWHADPNKLDAWLTGLDSLESVLKQKTEPKTLNDIAQLFDDVMSLNEVVFNLPKEVIIAHFAEASLTALDPYTNLVWPEDVREFEKSLTQQFSGIGVEISKTAGAVKIGSLLPDTPAYHAGLDAEDEIIAVNGESTEKMSIFCAVEKITGPKNTKVKLTIRRPSTGKTWDVTIVRNTIQVQPLRGWQRRADGQWEWNIDPANKLGYVRLTDFTETSGPDLDKILTTLEKDGLNGLILDLRYNRGGYLTSAAEVVDLFVKDGVIVKSSPRQGLPTYEIARGRGTHPDYPLVVLINEGSASASEIVAGALQDPKHNRATLVGQRSYGKGSVQVVTAYTGGGSQLKYTVAYYHLPSDQPVKNRYQMEKQGRKDWGIAPDVTVKTTLAELIHMLDVQRDNDVLVQATHDEMAAPINRTALAETIDSDPQLATAILVLQSKLIQAGTEVQFPAEPNSIVLKIQK